MTRVRKKREEGAEQRRQAILEAALKVFSADGFAAARLDDVAEKAGVAKGTIYLSFKDKEDLFEQMLLAAIGPVVERIQSLAAIPSLSLDEFLKNVFDFFRIYVLAPSRRDVILLVLTEGRRFPKIAEIYHREVISKGLELVRGIAQKAHERGELDSRDLVRFPHLVFAPVMMSLIWDGTFSKLQPLDVEGLLGAHRNILTGAGKKARKA